MLTQNEASGTASFQGGSLAARLRHAAYWVAWLLIVAFGVHRGFAYYVTPYEERPFAPGYELLRPAGREGLRYGLLGTLAIAVGVGGYALRKRVRRLARAGKLKFWLEGHIFLCSVGPVLVLLHTSFHVGGLIAVAFWSMVIVALSGVFGRYVYVWIPRTVQGQFASFAALEGERARLLEALRRDLGAAAALEIERLLASGARGPATGVLGALATAARFDLVRRRLRHRLKRALAALDVAPGQRREVEGLLERQLELEQQLAVLVPFQRLFRYWHLFHVPLAVSMFLVVAVHVAIATAFGYAWPW